jgi:hypothetical protein
METTVGQTATRPAAAVGHAAGASYVEWSAVFAGAVLAAAASFVLLTFGTAIGLSATSAWPQSGLSTKTVATLAILWGLMQQIGAFMAGGYVAGRMRTRWSESGDEADFRDGLHGGLVWGVGVAFGALLLVVSAGAAARTGVEAAGRAGAAAAAAANDPMGAAIDTMLRPTSATAQAAPTPAAPPAAGTPASPQPSRRAPAQAPADEQRADEQRAEIARLLAAAATGDGLPAQDKAYLAQLVAQRTGLSQQEAERRVDDAVAGARQAADKARRTGVLTAFVTAAGLVISLAAAWWAALKGGNHRDNAVPARFAFTSRRRTTVPS